MAARPLKEGGNSRHLLINIRMTDEENAMLETLAEARGMDKTALIVALVKEDTERRQELMDMLAKMKELRQ